MSMNVLRRGSAAIFVALIALVGPLLGPRQADAQVREQRAQSPFTLDINRVFAWNNQGAIATAPDCKSWQDAFTAFEAMRGSGKQLIVITDPVKIGNFIAYAFYDGDRRTAYTFANLEAIVIEPVESDRYQVYTGSKTQRVFCGFDRPQVLDRKWLDAGLKQQMISEPAPEPSPSNDPLKELAQAYLLQQYSLVRNSLDQRGFKVPPRQGTIAERCAPTFEPICQTYPEAICRANNFPFPTNCIFVWLFNGQLVGVRAYATDVTRYSADIEVLTIQKLDRLP